MHKKVERPENQEERECLAFVTKPRDSTNVWEGPPRERHGGRRSGHEIKKTLARKKEKNGRPKKRNESYLWGKPGLAGPVLGKSGNCGKSRPHGTGSFSEGSSRRKKGRGFTNPQGGDSDAKKGERRGPRLGIELSFGTLGRGSQRLRCNTMGIPRSKPEEPHRLESKYSRLGP